MSARASAREASIGADDERLEPMCDNARGGVGQTVASSARVPRKVRAPQGKVPGNAWAARADG